VEIDVLEERTTPIIKAMIKAVYKALHRTKLSSLYAPP
jgi:hypothetical protein